MPWSARVCDAAVFVFGLWTLCSHAVVAAGGSLAQLVGLYAGVGSGLLVVFWWLRRRREPAARPAPDPDPPPRAAWLRALQGGGLALGIAAAFASQQRGGVVALWIFAVALLGAAAALFVLAERPVVEEPASGPGIEIGLWVLALAAVVIALVTHRPDIDDAFYVNVAVTAADFPGEPLLARDSLHGAAELPLMLPVYRLHSYELWNGMLSWITGRPAIEIFHWVSAALAALLLPLAHARALRWLTPRDWLWAVAAVLVVLVGAGETHRWYGNFALVRIWQGKGIFLFVFLPLIYAYAIEFARRPTSAAWLRLALAQVCALGCSSSSLWAAPAAALMALACVLRPTLSDLRRYATGALSIVYVVAASALARVRMVADGHTPGEKKLVEDELGARVEEAIEVALGTEWLLVFGVAALLASWAACRRGLGQRFAIVLPLAVVLVLLNPFTSRWVLENVTGSSYWRVMWALPLPILMAFLLVAPLQLGGRGIRRHAAAAGSVALMLAFVFFVPSFGALDRRNEGPSGVGIRVGKPGLKVEEVGWRWAAALNAAVPPGSVVIAPWDIGRWVPTFHDHARPLEVRPSYLKHYKEQLGVETVRIRHMLSSYVAGESQSPKDARIFARALDVFEVDAVCLRRSPRTLETRRLLKKAGFESHTRAPGHEIWVRAEGA